MRLLQERPKRSSNYQEQAQENPRLSEHEDFTKTQRMNSDVRFSSMLFRYGVFIPFSPLYSSHLWIHDG